MTRDEQKQKARVIGRSDQSWAGLKALMLDIERIANGGLRIDDKRDRDIVRGVFSAIAGDLHLRAAERIESWLEPM